MNITTGIIQSAQKVVVYGPEGIGKSTFAACFPKPVFIDTEGSTKYMNVSRLPKPTSWSMLLEEVRYIKDNNGLFNTLVVDTIDWAEQLCINNVCSSHNKKGIEDFGYGNGYVYVKEEMGRFLNLLEEVVKSGVNVVLTAHAQIRKFEQPDEMGAYDRYELKLGKKTSSQTSPLVKEWADTVLFANYKTFSVAADDKGKKFKAQGGARVMYTSHHPCWDAKNRWGLKPELPFEYKEIESFILSDTEKKQPVSSEIVYEEPKEIYEIPTQPVQSEQSHDENEPVPIQQSQQMKPDNGLPKALNDLMDQNYVTEDEIRLAVSQRGYYPYEMPVSAYDTDFINGVLIAAWSQVYAMIEENRKNEEVPF